MRLPALAREAERVVAPQAPVSSRQPIPSTTRNRGLDLHLPTGGSGGGAIDPISAAIGLGLASAAAAAAKRRRAKAASSDKQ